MKGALILVAVLGLLVASTAAFAAGPPSLELVIKNVGSSTAKITVTRAGMSESKNPITKKAAAGNKVRFSRQETAHDPSEQFPIGWDVYIFAAGINSCHYVIALDKNNQCQIASGTCALVEACDQCCYVMTIKPD